MPLNKHTTTETGGVTGAIGTREPGEMVATGPKSYPKFYSAQDRAVQELQSRIAHGLYRPGATLPSERQLAQEIGISRPVIRAALRQLAHQGLVTHSPHHRPSVAKEFKELVGQTGTVETGFSGASVPGVPGVPGLSGLQAIAAVLPMEPTFRAAYDIQHGIQRVLQRHQSPYRLVVFDLLAGTPGRSKEGISRFPAQNERQILESIAREGIAGVILWHLCGQETLPAVLSLREQGVPVVFVDRYPDYPDYPDGAGTPPCDFVGVDNRVGAREAVSYLISLGHERIAHLTFPRESPESAVISVRERLEGYREALWENGLPFDSDLVGTGPHLVDLIQASPSSLAPTAVFAVNDVSAHGFIARVVGRGIRVPLDLSVIGFDDLDRHSPPSGPSGPSALLSSVHVPFGSVGQRAAELLLERLAAASSSSSSSASSPAAVQHTLLSTRLVIRKTCAERIEGQNEEEGEFGHSLLQQGYDQGYSMSLAGADPV